MNRVASLLCLRCEACVRLRLLLPALTVLGILHVGIILLMDCSCEAIGLWWRWRGNVILWLGRIWICRRRVLFLYRQLLVV